MHITSTSDASMVHAPKVPRGPRDAKAARALSRFPESRFIPSTNVMCVRAVASLVYDHI